MPDKITILLADDHRSYAEGLTALFRDDEHLRFATCVHDPTLVLEAVQAHSPQVVLMDYSFGEGRPDGIEVAEQLLGAFPHLKIIMLTSHDDLPTIRHAVSTGLVGYLLKERSRSELKLAIQAVAAGFEVVEAGVLRKTLGKSSPRPRPDASDPDIDLASPLTPRELEIALLIAEGLSNQAISDRLFRSVNTVDTHRKNIFSKLGVHNVAELMNWLRGKGLV